MRILLLAIIALGYSLVGRAEDIKSATTDEEPRQWVARLKTLLLQENPPREELDAVTQKIIKLGKKAALPLVDLLLLDEKTCRHATMTLCQMTHSRMLTAPMSGWDTPYEGEQLKDFHWSRAKSCVEFLTKKKLGDLETFPGTNKDEKTVAAMKALLAE